MPTTGPLPKFGGALLSHNGDQFYDATTFSRLVPATGRKYPANLTPYAADGRFVYCQNRVISTQTEKHIDLNHRWNATDIFGFVPGYGCLTVSGSEVRLLPDAKRLDIPPAALELWAQVAVRGQLGRDGGFVKWDEATWESKRQELATAKQPYPDFPFPGYVATDKLHWLRAEFGEATTDAEKLRLARELLSRAEAAGDTAEAVQWRAEVRTRVPEIAPAPRPAKE